MAIAIANYLTTNQTLSHLDLRNAKIDNRSQSLLADALTKNQTLSEFLISGKLNPEITSILDRNLAIKLQQSSLISAPMLSIRSVYR